MKVTYKGIVMEGTPLEVLTLIHLLGGGKDDLGAQPPSQPVDHLEKLRKTMPGMHHLPFPSAINGQDSNERLNHSNALVHR